MQILLSKCNVDYAVSFRRVVQIDYSNDMCERVPMICERVVVCKSVAFAYIYINKITVYTHIHRTYNMKRYI